MDLTILNLKSQCRADNMKSLDSCRTRIDDEHIILHRIAYDLEDVGMAAYEDVRTIRFDEPVCLEVISAGISADVGHEYLHAFALPTLVERMVEAERMVVAVSCHSDQRLERGYLLGKVHASAEITGVPDLVDRRKELLDALVEYSMCI